MDKKTLLWLFENLRPYTYKIVFLLICSLAISCLGIAVPILLQRLFDSAVNGSVTITAIAFFFIVKISEALPFIDVLKNKLAVLLEYDIRGKLYIHLLRMDISFHDERGSTALVSQLKKGAEAVNDLVNILCDGGLLISIPVSLFAFYYIGTENKFAALLLFAFLIVFLILGNSLGKKMQANRTAYEEIDDQLMQRQSEALEQITTVKVHRAEQYEISHFDTQKRASLDLFNKLVNAYGVFWFFRRGSGAFAIIVVISFFLFEVSDGSITIGTFLALMMYATKAIEPASYLGQYYVQMKELCAKIAPIIKILEIKAKVTEQKNALTLNPLRHEICFKDVEFMYPETEEVVLHNVSFSIPAGKKTAIVGTSGSGKTTLVRLLTRLYDPHSGVIECDGTDLRCMSFESLYKEIAYLTQEVPIFTGTVMDNVAFGLEECEESDVVAALKCSSANFVESFETGIHAKIGVKGKKLSGGERQRVAIARIFMRKPSIIILDEATSALDNKKEAEVLAVFDELSSINGGTTIIVIAHRLSTVRNADQIVVLHEGKVLDTGNHNELMSRCELYQELNSTFV